MERMIKRGDIFYAELNPVIGSEQGGTRPVLVISKIRETGTALWSSLRRLRAEYKSCRHIPK